MAKSKSSISLFGSVFALVLISLVFNSTAQTSAIDKRKIQLEKQVEQLKKDIAIMERAIQTTSNKKKLTEKEVATLRASIDKKSKQIGTFKTEINSFKKDIEKTSVEIDQKVSTVTYLKEKYAKLLNEIYKTMVADKAAVPILFPDNTRFIHKNYLRIISNHRLSQASEIRKTIVTLEGKKSKLELSKTEVESKLKKEDQLKIALDNERKKKDQEISSLSQKEAKIKKQIEAKNKAAQKLNASIQRIIEEQIRLAKAKAEKNRPATTTTSKPANNADAYLTPKEMELSRDFASNQGRLPWPVAKGNITSSFGRHEHPSLKGVFIENNGVDFKTEAGATARAVFDGNVISIFYLPTTQNCVIVKHGEYFSVYSNIASPSVKVGDNVSTKQSLGQAYTDSDEKSTKIHLEIWKGKDKINPSLWLSNAR
jgi:septal ring factor EnvC (AmiA/AmiB activator)